MHPLFQKADELINFHVLKLTDGLVRMILPSAKRQGD
jgi:hypothetical protein